MRYLQLSRLSPLILYSRIRDFRFNGSLLQTRVDSALAFWGGLGPAIYVADSQEAAKQCTLNKFDKGFAADLSRSYPGLGTGSIKMTEDDDLPTMRFELSRPLVVYLSSGLLQKVTSLAGPSFHGKQVSRSPTPR